MLLAIDNLTHRRPDELGADVETTLVETTEGRPQLEVLLLDGERELGHLLHDGDLLGDDGRCGSMAAHGTEHARPSATIGGIEAGILARTRLTHLLAHRGLWRRAFLVTQSRVSHLVLIYSICSHLFRTARSLAGHQ